MKKANSKFYFNTEYQDKSNNTQNATVILDIDYLQKNYSITPFFGSTEDGLGYRDCGFSFTKTSHKWKMWKAITKGINDAIDFANAELNINN